MSRPLMFCSGFAVFVLGMLAGGVQPQAAEINAAARARVSDDVKYLSSDELEGRGVGTEGLRKAADHIRDEFKRLGLKSGTPDGNYFQPFKVLVETSVVKERTLLNVQGPKEEIKLELGSDYQPFNIGGEGKAKADVVFAGYGITAPEIGYDDYKGLDVAGKVVIVLRKEPQQEQEDSKFDGKKVTKYAYIQAKVQNAIDHKAAALLLVNDELSAKQEKGDKLALSQAFGTRKMGIPFAQVTQAFVNRLLAASPVKSGDAELKTLAAIEKVIDEKFQPVSQPLAGFTADLEFSFEKIYDDVVNVIGVIEGEGPKADETIIIGAHYDHLGWGGFGSRKPTEKAVHNGADDNASGTAALLEIARRFAPRKEKPARRLVFMAYSAEERGLLGSAHYVKEPLFPLDKVIAMYNYDMVGHVKNDTLIVSGVKTGEQFADLLDAANAGGTLKLNKASGVRGDSDHYSFYQKKVPVLHFFTGITEEYHTPEDDFPTLNLDGMVQVVDFSEALLDKTLALTAPPTYAEVSSPAGGGRGGMSYFGVKPDYGAEVAGLLITGTSPGSPADKGGLKGGDIVIQMGDIKILDIQGMADALRKYKPGETIDVTVKREDAEVSMKVTLEAPNTK